MRLREYLADGQRDELAAIERHATDILAQPLDHAFTDHTVEHSRRIEVHLDGLLSPWAARQMGEDRRRTETEIFVLLAATYLHDIGMQLIKRSYWRSVLAEHPTFARSVKAAGLTETSFDGDDDRVARRLLDQARRHHHLVTLDWLSRSNLRSGQATFPDTGLRTHPDHVARVAWAHGVRLDGADSLRAYESALPLAEEQEGRLRLPLLAAFLRLGDLLDLDRRRVDVERLKRIDIPTTSQAHWWRHHFVRTCRLDRDESLEGRRLHVAFSVPEEHEGDLPWLREALYSATVEELAAEQLRLARWLWPAGVRLRLPRLEECRVDLDATGQLRAMPPEAIAEFRRTWPAARGDLAEQELRRAIAKDELTGDLLADRIRPLSVRAEIQDYLHQVEAETERSFRTRPYAPIEIDYGDFEDALDALEAILATPDPNGRALVILGDPGGGKTTLLRRYVLDCARGRRPSHRVPIYVQANRYGDAAWADEMHAALGDPRQPLPEDDYLRVLDRLLERLLRLVAETLCDLAGLSYAHRDTLLATLREVMAHRPCLVVLDGLNEAPPSQRSLAALAAEHFAREYRGHRLVVTSRTGDYREDYFPEAPVYTVQPLQPGAIRDYWSQLGVRRSEQDRALSAERGAMGDLARNPMYMYMLGELLKAGQGESLSQPGRLFRRFTQQMLRRWHAGRPNARLTPDEMHRLLAELAFRTLDRQEVSFERARLEETARAWLERQLPEEPTGGDDVAPETAAEGVDPLVDEMLSTGLIGPQGSEESRRHAFRHHATHDYFAAEAIRTRPEQLPALAPKPVFHEPFRILAGLVDDPSAFLRSLLAATSEGFGRAEMLPLCFRVAGAAPESLAPDVITSLCAGLTPLLEAARALRLPYALDVVCHLVSQTRPQVLATWLARLAEDPLRAQPLRDLASRAALRALTHDGRFDEAAVRAILDVEIEAGLLEAYAAAQSIVQGDSDATGALRRAPLLIGGLTASISLSVPEKRQIAHSLARLTPNQAGALESIFVTEWIHFGALLLHGFRYYPELVGVVRRHLADLLLSREDDRWSSGDTRGAVAGCLEHCATHRVVWPAIVRLVLRSGDATGPEVRRICDMLGRLEGADLPWSFAGVLPVFPVERKIAGGGVHPDVRTAALRAMRASDNPWLVLFLESLARSVPWEPAVLDERWDELTRGLELSGESGLLFLTLASRVARSEHIAELLAERYPEWRRDRLLDGWKGDLLAAAGARGEPGPFPLRDEVVFDADLVETLVTALVDEGRENIAKALVDRLRELDKARASDAMAALLLALMKKQPDEPVHLVLEQLGISPDWLLSASSGRAAFSAAQYEYGKQTALPEQRRQISRAFHWDGERWAQFVVDADDVSRVLSLLEVDGRLAEACAAACAAIPVLATMSAQAEAVARMAAALAVRLEPTEGEPTEGLQQVVDALFPLIGDRANGSWALKLLEALRQTGGVDVDRYADRLASVLRARQAHIAPDDRTRVLKILSAQGRHTDVLECLDEYATRTPPDPAAAAGYLGSGAWYAYLARDFERYRSLTERALGHAPEAYRSDWLLGNRAFALFLVGREDEAREAYRRARAAVVDAKCWQNVAVEDLEQHAERLPDAPPVPPAFVEFVRSLGADLPPPPPPPSEE